MNHLVEAGIFQFLCNSLVTYWLLYLGNFLHHHGDTFLKESVTQTDIHLCVFLYPGLELYCIQISTYIIVPKLEQYYIQISTCIP